MSRPENWHSVAGAETAGGRVMVVGLGVIVAAVVIIVIVLARRND